MKFVGGSDQELLVSLQAVCADSRRVLARLIEHLIEVEDRRLELRSAFPSMFEFCMARLGMSEGEACRRIAAARLVRRFPGLLVRIENGALNLTTLLLLRDVLSESNVERVVDAASGKTKRQVEELVARLAPKSDVAPSMIQLPSPAAVISGLTESPRPVVPAPRVVPLSENRYEVRFTANTELRDKIDRAKDLLRHRHPNGDLEAIMNRAFDALLGQLEKERLGRVKRPRKPKEIDSDHVQQATRREVFERDREQRTYVDVEGNRCPAKGFLELDHRDAIARGRAPTTDNLRVFCRPHNRLHAEQDFGEAHVAAQIHRRQQGWPALIETARSGLSNLGFKPEEIARTLEVLEVRHATPPPIEAFLREALVALT